MDNAAAADDDAKREMRVERYDLVYFSKLASFLCPRTTLGCVAVSGIKKSQLSEVKSMANPPGAVKLALESVCLMLNCETSDWKQIRAIMVKDSFISTIVNFDTLSITYGKQVFILF